MLNINERAQCGVPVIIEGETGVGKTALIEMLSRLWNYSLIKNCNLYKDRLLDRIKGRLEGKHLGMYIGLCLEIVCGKGGGNNPAYRRLAVVNNLKKDRSNQQYFITQGMGQSSVSLTLRTV